MPADTSDDRSIRQERAKRARGPKSLPKTADGSQPYALDLEPFRGMAPGEAVALIRQTAAWQDVMMPVCEKLDATRYRQRKRKGGFQACYTSEHVELVLLTGALDGKLTVHDSVELVGGIDDRNRLALGLTPDLVLHHPRPKPSAHGRLRKALTPGVPSEATISKHLRRFGDRRRWGAYQRLFRRLTIEHAVDPDFRQESRVLYQDGYELPTIYRPPMTASDLTSSEWADKPNTRITCPDGGYQKRDGGKGGPGFKVTMQMTSRGLITGWVTGPMQQAEVRGGEKLLARFRQELLPHLGEPALRVLVTDGVYHGLAHRSAARKAGILESTHFASHGTAENSKNNAAKRDKLETPIEDHPDWYANGHREIRCRCGNGSVGWRAGLTADGESWSRLEGQCDKCGSISITSGQWRYDDRSTTFVRCDRGHPDADLALGNGLTYNSPVSAIYAKQRFGRNEGVHGVLSTRFGIGGTKQRWRTFLQVDTRIAMIACLTHGLALTHRAWERGQQSSLAPPALAA